MRVLVYPHDLAMGGSQLNAIDLAAAVRDRGHHVVVAGQPGPLVAYVDSLGLAFAPLPVPHRRPSSAVMRELRAITAREQLDVVHGYEWPPGLEAYLGVEARDRVPSVSTVMSMSVAPFLPRHQPLIVGTRQIRESVRSRPGPVHVIEPPVDTAKDARTAPGLARAVDRLRSDHGLSAGELTVVVVSRLARELKLEGLLAAVDVVADLAAEFPVRLLVVGDGPAREEVATRADAANERAGTRAVVLVGALTDPRPAYAAADVVLGMGSSILRGMAFETAAIVQGEDGFWETLTPRTADVFRWQGWYGCGQVTTRPGEPPAGPDRLRFLLRELLASSALRRELGMFSRHLVCAEFSLVAMALREEAIYHTLVEAGPAPGRVPDSARSIAGLGGYKAHRRWQRLRNQAPEDDFNAKARLPGPAMPVPAAGSGRKP